MNVIATLSSEEVRTEARRMFSLALPAVIAQLSQKSMGFVDTLMVAKLGPEAMGAVGIGNAVYFLYLVFSFGTLIAISPMVAQAYGAGDDREISRAVGQGLWLAAVLAAVGIVIAWNTDAILLLAGQKPEIAALAADYTRALSYGLAANLWFSVLRAFCDAVGRTRVAMVISFVAILVNVVFDYILIYGKLGFPALGPAGAGYATAIVRWSMLGLIAFYVLRSSEFRRYRFIRNARPIEPKRIKKILRLGLPIGITYSMEQGFFGLISLLMGIIGTIPLAAHQASMILAGLAFMIPRGISLAITARVGQAIGRGDHRGTVLAGWVGIGLGTFFTCITVTMFFVFPGALARIFTHDPEVVAYAAGLLVLAGAFQIFDGIQVLAIGALRGMKDTTRSMMISLVSYWLIGLPCGWMLAFRAGIGGQGLWWGLVIGLSVAATLHTLRFRKLVTGMGGIVGG